MDIEADIMDTIDFTEDLTIEHEVNQLKVASYLTQQFTTIVYHAHKYLSSELDNKTYKHGFM